jgi:hypothetical protein
MDPNANLAEQLMIAHAMLSAADFGEITPHDAARLAQLVEALDEWIRRGGFLPKRWIDEAVSTKR